MNKIWLTLLLFLIVVVLLIVVFDWILRKLFKVERLKYFSYNHINEQHKKIDMTIRFVFTIVIITSTLVKIYGSSLDIWYLEVWFLIILFIIATEATRAVMEWKYEKNRNAFIVTIIEIVFYVFLIVLIITTNFFGLLSALF